MTSSNLKNVEDIYPLSPLQQGMLFHALYAPGTGVYVIQYHCGLSGELDIPVFQETWRRVLERHTALRTAFLWESLREPHQVVHRAVELPWSEHDWRELPESERGERFQALLEAERKEGFDLTRAPLMRLALVRTGEDSWSFVWTFHHLLMDGWSSPLVLEEVFTIYGSLARGRSLRLKRPRPYRDYIDWLQAQDLAQAEAFWRGSLAGFPGATPFGIDKPQAARDIADIADIAADTAAGHAELERMLPEGLSAELHALAREHRLTLNTLVLGAWALLLHHYSGEPAVTFGTVVSGRPSELSGVESIVGPFINTLPVRIELPQATPFLTWLKDLQDRQLELRRFEYTPLAQIQKWSGFAGVPLFESIFVFENYPVRREQQAAEGGSLRVHGVRQAESTHYPLEVSVEALHRVSLRAVFERGRFEPASIRRLLDHLESLLHEMAAGAARRVGELSPLAESERHQVLFEWNDTRRGELGELRAHELIALQAEHTPDAIAVVGEGERITYRQLLGRAGGLAALLAERGVGPNAVVALLAERGPAFWTAALAVLAAGGAYLPLDPRHPAARQARVIADSRASIALVEAALLPGLDRSLEEGPAGRPALLPLEEALAAGGEGRLARPGSLDDLAYVIYTSGSTGVPKGAMVAQRGMLNHLLAKVEELGLTPGDSVAQTASQCFDISVWQFLAPLLVGGTVHVLPDEVAHDPAALLERIDRDGISIVETVPSLMRYLLDEVARRRGERPRLAALRWLIPTGEALPPELCVRWLTAYPEIPLLNAYGPTECSDDVSHHPIREVPPPSAASVPIGQPLANTRLYVLNRELWPAPAGTLGELFVAGAGVGRGYLHDPLRTAETFVPDPFAVLPGERLYRTGDLARHRFDGRLEFAGRNDHQVKIRGHRIELGEIESALARHPGIAAVVVDARAIPGEAGARRLVAWVKTRAEETSSAADLRAWVVERLPESMVPSAYVFLEDLPLTANGKVDRRALPEPDMVRPEPRETFVAPRTPDEEVLASLWAQALGLDRVGVRDNFFALGGDSILSIRVLSLARERGLSFSLQELFQHPTIEELVARRAAPEGEPSEPEVAPFALVAPTDRERLPEGIEDAYPLARLQAGMLFHSERSSDTFVYHYVISLQLRVPFDAEALDAVLQELARRHPILRTSFELARYSEPLQLVHREARIPLQVTDLGTLPEERQRREVQAWIAGEKGRRFDWSRPPLLRVQIHRFGDESFQFTLVYHHSILDGWSEATLLSQLFRGYTARLRGEDGGLDPAPEVGFRDFVALERKALASEEARGFWMRQLEDAETTELPSWPAARRGAEAPDLREARVAIPAATAAGLQRLAESTGVPIKSVLLAAHLRTLALLSGQSDVTTGLVLSCRPESADSERALGLFLNNAPLRLGLPSAGTWTELVRAAFDAECAALPHRWFPLAELQRSTGGTRLFETVFNFVHFHVYQAVQSAGQMQVLGGRFIEETDLPLVVTCGMDPFTAALDCTLKYSPLHFCQPQVRHMAAAYERVLAAMAEEPHAPYASIGVLADAELPAGAAGVERHGGQQGAAGRRPAWPSRSRLRARPRRWRSPSRSAS